MSSMMNRTASAGSSQSSSTRYESFTEAVPLSLSSMAHANLPFLTASAQAQQQATAANGNGLASSSSFNDDDAGGGAGGGVQAAGGSAPCAGGGGNHTTAGGVLDGLCQVLSHTLLSCVNYARIVHPPHLWTFRDLATSEFAWEPFKTKSVNDESGSLGSSVVEDLPFSLHKLNFRHQYTRNAWIYLRPAMLQMDWGSPAEEYEHLFHDWMHQVGILGRVSLLYVSKEALTPAEMDGTDTEDMPPTILYKVVVEYRSLPATGSQQAVQAEELSMLSFGGSIDDDVKYGALASLYDETAKYVLEIYSVRGKKYKFDLMDATLSDGSIPRLPYSREGDPFVKCLCATVTDHATFSTTPANATTKPSDDESTKEKRTYSVTRIHLTLEGKLRQPFEYLPRFDYVCNGVTACFLLLNPHPPDMIAARQSGHALLLEPNLAGHIYVNGRYVTSWGNDPRIGSQGVALFGVDFQGIPFWHGQIVDYEVMKAAYAQLWHELLVDASLLELNLAKLLLYRLMLGRDPEVDDDDELYDDDDELELSPEVHLDCLESQIFSTTRYDLVGIVPKALATRFSIEFGKEAYPCLPQETEWVQSALPDRRPVIVPQRLISVLRRGGYFDIQKTVDDTWFGPLNTRPPKEGIEKELVEAAINLLEEAECDDVMPEQIVVAFSLTNGEGGVGSKMLVSKKGVCRYNENQNLFSVQEQFMSLESVDDLWLADTKCAADTTRRKAYLLGLLLAREHPDGEVLVRYMLRHKGLGD